MILRILTICGLAVLTATGQQPPEPPEAAVKYLRVLIKRPHQETLFDRFEGAWLDQRSSAELEEFLRAEATRDGGAAWTLLARYHLRRGDDQATLEALGEALEASPADAELRLERARVKVRLLDFDAAVADLEKARAGDDPELALQASKLLGKTLLRAGEFERAGEVWDETLAAHPGDEDLLEDLVELAAAEGETEQALGFLEQLREATADPYRKVLQGLRKGDLLGAAGRFDEAVASYDETLDRVGEGSWLEREVLAQIEKLFRQDGRANDLREHMAGLAETHPGRLGIHRQVARLDAAAGEIDAAIGRFREVLQRSPGNRELREEFIRMLADGERVGDAVEELEKLIAQTGDEAELWLQMAALRHRQEDSEATLAALEKARGLLGEGEGEALRVAALMLEYGLEEEGVALLRERIAAEGATTAPAESLAAWYSRNGRKDEALALLEKLCAEGDLEALLRAQGSLAALGGAEKAFELMATRRDEFVGEPRFVAAWLQVGLAAEKAGEVAGDVERLVRMAQGPRELGDTVALGVRVIGAAELRAERTEELAAMPERPAALTCLLAGLHESAGDFPAVRDLFEGVEDPELTRFHAALLENRGELGRAVEVLAALEDTEEGRKASYLKELAELQKRAGLDDQALETAGRWKQAAPGDKAAWVFRSRQLEDAGKRDEALREMRQAAARFEGDADLLAGLAELHAAGGETAEAESIYWRLYDDSTESGGQSRWAVALAKLAVDHGRTGELEQRLLERTRANRKSVGPLLARAELARLMNDESKRRDLLLEAVRLQPTDLDLRLQIASLEEQSGEPERAMAILDEAVSFDRDLRVRRALVSLYLRHGQVERGLRQMRELTGGEDADPRELERLAISLAENNYHEEAIAMLRAELEDGDWRSKFLLAKLMIEDGRELEALPLMLDTLHAEGELDGLAASNQHRSHYDSYPPVVRDLMLAIQVFQKAAQRGSRGPAIYLPESETEARLLARSELMRLKPKVGDAGAAAIEAGMESAGVEEDELLVALAEGDLWMNNPAVMHRFPDHPASLVMALQYGGSYDRYPKLDADQLGKVLEIEGLSTHLRLQALTGLNEAAPDDPAIARQMLDEADRMAADEDGSPASAASVLLKVHQRETLPDEIRDEIEERLAEWLERTTEEGRLMIDGPLRLAAWKALGEDGDVAAVLNRATNPETGQTPGWTYFRQLGRRITMWRQMAARSHGVGFEQALQPQVSPEQVRYSTVPYWLLNTLDLLPANTSMSDEPVLGLDELREIADELESPVLRGLIALKDGDEAGLDAALAAEATGEQAMDLLLLAFVRESGREEPDPAKLWDILRDGRAKAADRDSIVGLDLELLARASGLPEEAREARSQELRGLLARVRAELGPGADHQIASFAGDLGFEDLKERYTPRTAANVATGPSTLGAAAVGRTTSGGGGGRVEPKDRVLELVAENKHPAAAREAWQAIREMRQQSHRGVDDMREMIEHLGADGVAALKKQLDPGASKSRTKRLEYIDLLELTGDDARRLELLEEIHRERPHDGEVAARLVFTPEYDAAEVTGLLEVAVLDGDELAARARSEIARATEDPQRLLHLGNLGASWLEDSDPEKLRGSNLTWTAYMLRTFADNLHRQKLPSLVDDRGQDGEELPDHAEEREEMVKRLALATIRHPAVAEAGFRVLAAWGESGLTAEELDALAREVIAKPDEGMNPWSGSPFTLRVGTSGSSRGGRLDEWSPWRWIDRRIADGTSAESMFPETFREELRQVNPKLGELLDRICETTDADGVAELLGSSGFESLDRSLVENLNRIVLTLARDFDGLQKALTAHLDDMPTGDPGGRIEDAASSLIALVLGATAERGTRDEVEGVLKRAAEVFFGDDLDFQSPLLARTNKIHYFSNVINDRQSSVVARLRLQAAGLRLGIPVAYGDYALRNGLILPPPGDAATAEKVLEDAEWLGPADRWTPPGGIVFNQNHSPAGFTVELKQAFILDELLRQLNLSRNDQGEALKERLEKRGADDFGARVIMAALSSGDERAKFAGEAFANAAESLARMSDAELERLLPVAAWAPREAFAKLPEGPREKFEQVRARQWEETLQAAKERLERIAADGLNHDPFDAIEGILPELCAVSVGEAAELFAEAERIYTESLVRGGSFSNWGTSGYKISRRDSTLYQLLRNLEGSDPLMALRFLVALMDSPAAARMAWTGPGYDEPFEQAAGAVGAELKLRESGDDWLERVPGLIEKTRGLDAALRGPVFAGGLALYMRRWNSWDVHYAEQSRGRVAQMDEDIWVVTARAMFGVLAWDNEGPERHAEVRRDLLEFLRSDELAMPPKFELARQFMTKRSQAFATPELAAALADLFEEYAAGERSVVNPAGGLVVRVMLEMESEGDDREPARRVTEAYWENSREAKAAGHSPIPEDVARNLFLLSKLGGHEAAATLLPQVRSGMRRDFPAVLHLLRAGDEELARSLLPGKGEDFERWTTWLVWSASVEEPLEAFLAKLDDPERRLKLMTSAAAFSSFPANRPAKISPEERAGQSLATYLEALIDDSELAARVLDRVSRHMPWDARIGREAAAWAEGKDVSAIVNAALTSEFGSVAERQADAEIAVCGWAAGWELAAGRTGLMEELTSAWQQAGSHPRVESNFETMVRTLAWSLINALVEGRTEGFAEGAGPMADLAVFAGTVDGFIERTETSTPLLLSRMMWMVAGEEARMEEHLQDAPEKVRKVAEKSKKGQPMPIQLARLLSAEVIWNTEAAGGFKHAFMRTVLTTPSLTEKMDNQLGWTLRLENDGLYGETMELAADPPEGIAPGLVTTLTAFRGRELRRKGDLETAETLTRSAIADATGDIFRNEMKVELAILLGDTERAEEALELLKTLADDKKPNWLKKRYEATLEELRKEVEE